MQLHATPSGRFVGINYDYAQAPCNPAQEVALPNELNFEESASVPVWLPVEAPVLRKREPILGEGQAVTHEMCCMKEQFAGDACS